MKDFTTDTIAFEKDKPQTMKYAATHTNPDLNKGEEFRNNCQRCIFAYELIRRGYKVKAKPKKESDDKYCRPNNWKELVANDQCFEIFRNEKSIHALTKEGERYAVIVVNQKIGAGHTFIIEKHGKKLYSIDPQTGERGVLHHYLQRMGLSDIASIGGIATFRLDNKIFTNKILDIVEGV